jgi:hypothetical protein
VGRNPDDLEETDGDKASAEEEQRSPLKDEASPQIPETKNKGGCQTYDRGSLETGESIPRKHKEEKPREEAKQQNAEVFQVAHGTSRDWSGEV